MKLFGEFKGHLFVPGQLVFYKPAPTIALTPKVGHALRPGIVLDYYFGPEGTFRGQYIVVDIEDFIDTDLYYLAEATFFTLRLHRTEVVRDPVYTIDQIFL